MARLTRSGLVPVLLLSLTGCPAEKAPPPPLPTPAPDTRPQDEAAIRAAIKEWAAAAAARNPEKFTSFYAEDATVLLPGTADPAGKTAIGEAITGMMKDANFALSFEADKVVVSRSGDIAYETGTYSMTVTDPKKKASTERGHYVVVWQKQSDSSWKVVVDAPVSDAPQGAAKP
jgi:uncharacterized protein (TIGR02246 family)